MLLIQVSAVREDLLRIRHSSLSLLKYFSYIINLHDTSNVNESLPSWRSTYQRYPLVKKRFWCYSIHGSVNDDPVRLLFCGDLTILLLGLIIYCLFLVKEKTAPQPSKSIAQRFSSISVDISHILGNLITVIFDYQILRKPLKILSLQQVNFPLLFPLCYIFPLLFMNLNMGKIKGKKIS